VNGCRTLLAPQQFGHPLPEYLLDKSGQSPQLAPQPDLNPRGPIHGQARMLVPGEPCGGDFLAVRPPFLRNAPRRRYLRPHLTARAARRRWRNRTWGFPARARSTRPPAPSITASRAARDGSSSSRTPSAPTGSSGRSSLDTHFLNTFWTSPRSMVSSGRRRGSVSQLTRFHPRNRQPRQ
jgi:hypothetical protein